MPTIGKGRVTSFTGEVKFTNDTTLVPVTTVDAGTLRTTDSSLLDVSIVGQNLGNGAFVYAGANGEDPFILYFRSLVALDDSVRITSDANSIYISATGDNDFVSLNDTPDAITPNGLLFGTASSTLAFLAPPTAAGEVLRFDGTNMVWQAGLDTDIAMVGLSGISVAGSPVMGSGTFTVSLAASGITPGTYEKVTVDAYGRVTAGAALSASDITSIIGGIPLTSAVTSISAFGTGGITVSGSPITGSGTLVIALSPTGVTAGTYAGLVVDAYGRVTATPGLSFSSIVSLLGYTPLSAALTGVSVTGGTGIAVTGSPLLASGPTSGTFAVALTNTGVAAGTYCKVTVDLTGRVTAGAQLSSADITAALGYTPPASTTINIAGNAGVTVSTPAAATGTYLVGLLGTGVSPGTYTKLVVDGYGRATSGGQLSTTDVTTALGFTPVSAALVGAVNGLATLDATGKVPASELSGVVSSVAAVGSGGITVAGSPITSSGTLSIALGATGVATGTYAKVSVDVTGRVLTGSALGSADITTALGFTPISTALEGVAGGVATLDSTGRILASQLPASITGAVVYQGVWNAATNSPTLTSGTGTKGYYYKVSVSGSTTLDGNAQWLAGDSAVFDGTTWDRIHGGATEVTAVAGRVGAVTLTIADISGAAPLASPALTGSPTAPTPATSDSSTLIATTAYVKAQGFVSAITLTGDVTGTGSGTFATSLAASGVTAGTYNTVGVDLKGRVISGGPLTTAQITTALGYVPASASGSSFTGTTVFVGGALGSTLSSQVIMADFQHTEADLAHLYLMGYRESTGSSWTSAAIRMQAAIGSAGMAYLDFNPGTFSGGLALGAPINGSATPNYGVIVDSNAYVTIPTRATFSGTAIFSGVAMAVTQVAGDSSTNVATTAFVKSQGYLTSASLTPSVVTTALGYSPVNRAGDTMTGNLAMGGNSINNAGLSHVYNTITNLGTFSSGTISLSTVAGGNFQRAAIAGSTTIAITAMTAGEMLFFELINGGSATMTWPTSINWIQSTGATTTSFSTYGVSLQASGTDFVMLWLDSQGNYYGKVVR